jgi:hypothetical protein
MGSSEHSSNATRWIAYEPATALKFEKVKLPVTAKYTSGDDDSAIPETPVKLLKVWTIVGVECLEMGTSKMWGAEKSMARTEPEGRTTRFSIQVPFGNSCMTSTGRFDEDVVFWQRLIVGRRARSQRLAVEKCIVEIFGESDSFVCR